MQTAYNHMEGGGGTVAVNYNIRNFMVVILSFKASGVGWRGVVTLELGCFYVVFLWVFFGGDAVNDVRGLFYLRDSSFQ